MSFDNLGNSLPCPKIDMNLTLSTARNETLAAQGMRITKQIKCLQI